MVAELRVQVKVPRAGDVSGGESVPPVGVGECPADIEDGDGGVGGEEVAQGGGGDEGHGVHMYRIPRDSR